MTQNEFWKNLKLAVSNTKKFERFQCSTVRWVRKRSPIMCFCPITLVCYQETGQVHPSGGFRKAGEVLGLKKKFVDDVANAADAITDSRVRTKLLKVIGV